MKIENLNYGHLKKPKKVIWRRTDKDAFEICKNLEKKIDETFLSAPNDIVKIGCRYPRQETSNNKRTRF